MSSICHRCGTEVAPTNDSTCFDAILTGNPFYFLAISRHLLPVIENDEVICIGSPSRAQYIEGQPRDMRGDYPYNPDQEVEMRQAYTKLQELEPVAS